MSEDLYNEYLKLKEDFSQKCVTESVTLDYIKYKADHGFINTNMDMQRNYVWTSEQEQELFDSLLLHVRIPEFHTLVENNTIWNICDGKQRLTCLFNILADKIPLLKKDTRPQLQWLFERLGQKNTKGNITYPSKIYFSSLPKDIQDSILLDTTLTIAKYHNLNRQEQILLFRKINNGTALSSTAKGLASYYYMRTDYTYHILDLPQFQTKVFMDTNQEDLETAIIRILLLITLPNAVDLQQQYLEKYYINYENELYINECKEKVAQTIKRFPTLDTITKSKAWRTGLPFLIHCAYRHPELNTNQLNYLITLMVEEFKPGRGNDLGVGGVKNRIILFDNFVKRIKGNN